MWQNAGYDQTNATSMAAPDTGAASEAAAGGEVVAVVFGPADCVPVAELSAYGVADAYAIEAPLLTGDVPQAWARALAGLAPELSPSAPIAAGTDRGREVMDHFASLTRLP